VIFFPRITQYRVTCDVTTREVAGAIPINPQSGFDLEKRDRTEGGEALTFEGLVSASPGRIPGSVDQNAHWFALWTHSHCEQLVHDQLIAKGFEAFLPTIRVWSRRGGTLHAVRSPMFSSYLFLRHAMDKTSYIEIMKTRGLVRILGERWDRLAVIAGSEIEAIQRVVRAELPILPHPYLREGQRVRITDGPLADVEGILTGIKPNKGLLVLSVELLQRSVAVEIDCMRIAPLGAIATRPSMSHRVA
jgi:transcription antitermination factor NusG